jgi:hypothetical protein
VKSPPRQPAPQLILAGDRGLVEYIANRGLALLLHRTSSLPLPAFRLGNGKLGNLKWIAAADQRTFKFPAPPGEPSLHKHAYLNV